MSSSSIVRSPHLLLFVFVFIFIGCSGAELAPPQVNSGTPAATLAAPAPSARVEVLADGPEAAAVPGSTEIAEPAAALASLDLDLGSVLVHDGAKKTVRISNPNDVAVPVRLVGFPSGGGGPFDVIAPTQGPLLTIEAHAAVDLIVNFSPGDALLYGATYGLHLCDGGCVVNLSLRGRGVRTSVLCDSDVAFPEAPPANCTTSMAHCLNETASPVVIRSWSIAGDSVFVLDTAPAARVLMPGDAQDISLRYCPSTPGQDYAMLSVAFDDPDPVRAGRSIRLVGRSN